MILWDRLRSPQLLITAPKRDGDMRWCHGSQRTAKRGCLRATVIFPSWRILNDACIRTDPNPTHPSLRVLGRYLLTPNQYQCQRQRPQQVQGHQPGALRLVTRSCNNSEEHNQKKVRLRMALRVGRLAGVTVHTRCVQPLGYLAAATSCPTVSPKLRKGPRCLWPFKI
jgi:hypothetical protein